MAMANETSPITLHFHGEVANGDVYNVQKRSKSIPPFFQSEPNACHCINDSAVNCKKQQPRKNLAKKRDETRNQIIDSTLNQLYLAVLCEVQNNPLHTKHFLLSSVTLSVCHIYISTYLRIELIANIIIGNNLNITAVKI